MRSFVFSLLLTVFAGGCGPDCERLPDADGGCPWGCVAVGATGVDFERGCALHEPAFRCVPETHGWTDDLGCVVRRSDGAVFSTPSGMLAYEDALFRTCTQADIDRGAAAAGGRVCE